MLEPFNEFLVSLGSCHLLFRLYRKLGSQPLPEGVRQEV